MHYCWNIVSTTVISNFSIRVEFYSTYYLIFLYDTFYSLVLFLFILITNCCPGTYNCKTLFQEMMYRVTLDTSSQTPWGILYVPTLNNDEYKRDVVATGSGSFTASASIEDEGSSYYVNVIQTGCPTFRSPGGKITQSWTRQVQPWWNSFTQGIWGLRSNLETECLGSAIGLECRLKIFSARLREDLREGALGPRPTHL